jgi:hypothetical protein
MKCHNCQTEMKAIPAYQKYEVNYQCPKCGATQRNLLTTYDELQKLGRSNPAEYRRITKEYNDYLAQGV